MALILPRWADRIPLAIMIAGSVLATAMVLAVWYYFSPEYTDVGYQPLQPVPYSHRQHAGDLGIDCRFCHDTVERAPFAAVPPTETCMSCHRALSVPKSVKLAPLREAYAAARPIRWVRVHMLPDYAYFDHRAHLAAGVGCVTCHGRVDRMDVVYQAKSLSMSWCLECHRAPSTRLRPRDKLTDMTYDPHEDAYDPDVDPERERRVDPPLYCGGCHR